MEFNDEGKLPAARPISASVQAVKLQPGLYLVATPIGTARDITLRALDVLNTAEVLAAEDTRTLRHLMDIHGIPLRGRRIIAYHDHNEERLSPMLVRALSEGASIAYTSDAGTPLVADPGYRLARNVAEAGYQIHAVPGASAALAALSVAGLPSDRFLFVGFPPSANGARKRWIESWQQVEATVIAFESPKRVKQFLGNVCETEPNRDVVICRELTKKFEEVLRGTAQELHDSIPDEGLRGEIVVLLGKPEPVVVDDAMIRAELAKRASSMSMRDASAEVATKLGLARRDVYAIALAMKDEKG